VGVGGFENVCVCVSASVSVCERVCKRKRERERERCVSTMPEFCTWHCLFDVLANATDLIG
jgi:hypothetical protein